MSLKTFLRVFGKAELRVKIALITVVFFLILTGYVYFSPPESYLMPLLVILTFTVPFYEGSPKGDSKLHSKQDKSWISWLQIEWLYQFYFTWNIFLSLAIYYFSIVTLKNYFLRNTIIAALISIIFFPLTLSIIFRILKKDEFQTRRSRIGRVCFAYLAENMMNLNRIKRAIKYMEYTLNMLDGQCQEQGFTAKSVKKTVFLLEVLDSKEVSCPDEIKTLAHILADYHTLDDYIKHLGAFLKAFEWFKDMKSVSPARHLFQFRKHFAFKIVTSIIVAIIGWVSWTYQNEIKDWISNYILPVLSSYEFLSLILLLILFVLPFIFLYLTQFIKSEYMIKLSDLEALVEDFDQKYDNATYAKAQ